MAERIIISLVVVGIYFGILLWLYSDAEENYNTGCLWVILVLFFNFPALAIYLIFFKLQNLRTDSNHRATNRNEDFSIRAQYIPKPRKGRDPTSASGGTMAGFTPADPDFTDTTLDRMIEDGKFSDARDYLDDMLRVAKELNDQKGHTNYLAYRTKIAQAQKKGAKKWKYDPSDTDSFTRY